MISILCPTRKRTNGLKRMWESAVDTADSSDDLELVLYVDYDDEETIDFLRSDLPEAMVIISNSEKPEIYSNLHNICCQKCTCDIFMSAADDIVFRSSSWDSDIIDTFQNINNSIGYVYPNDGHNGENLGTHGFFHKDWFNTLGYISPPIFSVDYSDNYVMDVAKNIDRCFYKENIFIEHMHWTIGKSSFDSTSKNAHIRRLQTDNGNIYRSPMTKQMINDDSEKLKSKMRQSNE